MNQRRVYSILKLHFTPIKEVCLLFFFQGEGELIKQLFPFSRSSRENNLDFISVQSCSAPPPLRFPLSSNTSVSQCETSWHTAARQRDLFTGDISPHSPRPHLNYSARNLPLIKAEILGYYGVTSPPPRHDLCHSLLSQRRRYCFASTLFFRPGNEPFCGC